MSNIPIASLDYLVIGAGPAGVQLGYFLEKAGRDYLIVDGAQVEGSFFGRFPRHRKLLSINKVYTGRQDPDFNLRHDWNSLLCDDPKLLFKNFSKEYYPPADVLQRYLSEFARHYALRVRLGFQVVRVGRGEEGGFFVENSVGDRLLCRHLVVATGLAKPYVPAIPGIELAEAYESVSVDREQFANQTVMIIGKGNSAFETAEELIPTAAMIHVISPHPVKLAWDTRFVGHLRAVNNNFLDTYQLKSQNAVIDGVIHSISRGASGKLIVRLSSIHAENEIEQLEYDRVIRCTGFRFDNSLFDADCRPELKINDRFPQLTGAWESTNVPGMYFAGTATQVLDFKRAQSSFIHGFRYNVRTLFHILESRYQDRPFPSESVLTEPRILARSIIDRMNNCSSLWQQVGFLCDVIVPARLGTPGQWFRDVNLDYVMHSAWGTQPDADYFVIMFRFGACPDGCSVFDHPREGSADKGQLSPAIHPVIARYVGKELVAEHHVLEDFLSDWGTSEYIDPLAAFFSRQIPGATPLTGPTSGPRELIRDAGMRFARRVEE